jgi:hypothetical protein
MPRFPLFRDEAAKKITSVSPGSVASRPFVLRQAQHEDRFTVASPNKIALILSLSKDEAAEPAPGLENCNR